MHWVEYVVVLNGDKCAWHAEDGRLKRNQPRIADQTELRWGRIISPVPGKAGEVNGGDQGFIEVHLDQRVCRQRSRRIEVSYDLKSRECGSAGYVDGPAPYTGPAPSRSPGTLPVKRDRHISGLHDPPGCNHLGDDAVFETRDEPLDLQCSRLTLAHRKGAGPSQSGQWSLQPAQSGPVVSFEEFDCPAINAR